MIIDKEIEIVLNSQNIKHYRDLGWDCKPNDKIIIPIEHLSKGSNYKINVRCDICTNEKLLIYNKYLKNVNNGGYYTCSNKCAVVKYKNNCLNKYGVGNVFQNEDIKIKSKNTKLDKYGDVNYNNCEKNKKTCLEKYGFEHYAMSDEFFNRMGYVLNDNLDDWNLYKRLSRRLFKKMKKEIFKEWNGYDYYDGEYIKDNLNLKWYDRLYPTIDHKISVYYGFKNNIPIEIINSIDNLCITKRYINSMKGYNNYNPLN